MHLFFPNKKMLGILSIATTFASFPALADIYVSTPEADEISITTSPQDGTEYIQLAEPQAATATLPILSNSETKNLPYHQEVLVASAETAIAPELIHAVIAVESKNNVRAVSKKGALGLMQLMPATAQRFKVNNKFDPQQNILAGAKYLRELQVLYDGNLSLMLAAYNAGPAAVEKYHRQVPPYVETQLYVPKVLKLYQRFSSKKS